MTQSFLDEPKSLDIWCSAGKVKVTIGERFMWHGVNSGTYKILGWTNNRMYSPSGIGGAVCVIVENEKGEQIEWCGDSVARGVHDTILK